MKRLASRSARIVLASLALVVSSAGTALADGPGHNGNVHNLSGSGHGGMPVCQNWGSCSGSNTKYLPPGKYSNSYFGWSDTDGYGVKPGYSLCNATGGKIVYNNTSVIGWKQLHGTLIPGQTSLFGGYVKYGNGC